MERTRVLEGKTVLVTGGTGSFGRRFVEVALAEQDPRKVIVFSRDELKQHEMRTGGLDDPRLRYFLGDVRDVDRLRRAMHGVDVVVHAAALKQVPACEYNPIEAVLTNVMGARNVIEASLDAGVAKVLALSTDKAVAPVNLYGATKLVAEKLFTQGNAYSGADGTAFACVRYGNVIASRGSVIPLFRDQARRGAVTITDPRMTRFFITLDEGVRFVLRAIGAMRGGEVFVPQIPSMRILELVEAVAPGARRDVVGIRAGEKLHETLVSADEARDAVELDGMFVLVPPARRGDYAHGKAVPDGFAYSSETNDRWLSAADLHRILDREA